MNLSASIALRSGGRNIQAGVRDQDRRFDPVHAGAHARLTKIGYIHTGNKIRGGVTTSNYFKRKGSNSRNMSVQSDGTYVKMSRTAKGERKSRGKLDAHGMKAHNVSHMHHPSMKPMAADSDGFSKGDFVHHPITKARGKVTHVYNENKNKDGRLVEVKYPNRTVNHRESHLTKSDIKADWSKWNEEHPYQSTGKQAAAKTDSEHLQAAKFHDKAAAYHTAMAGAFRDAASDNDASTPSLLKEAQLHDAAAAAHSTAAAWHRQTVEDGESGANNTMTSTLSQRAGIASSKALNPNR